MRTQKKPAEKGNRDGQLRTAAEEKLARAPAAAPEMKEKTAEELVHELRVHQIELEIQNEELKKAQRALEESRDRYVDLYDFAPVGYFTFTRGGRITEVNLTGAALLGVERQELLNRGFGHFVAPENLERWEHHLGSVLQHRQKQGCDLVLKREDGATFHVQLDSIRTEVGGGAPVVRTAVSDITERKRAEEALQASEAHHRELANSIADVFFGMDEHLRYTYWNKASEILTGIPAQDALGKSLLEVFPDTPETRRAEKVYRDVLTSQQSQVFVNDHVLGEKRHFFEISAYPSRRGISVFVKDITERKRAEEELRKSLRRFELLTAAAADLLVIADPQEFVETLCRRVMEHLDCHAFFNFLADEKAGRLHLNAYAGIPDEEARRIEWLDYGVAVCGIAARDGCRIVAENMQTTPDPRTEIVKSYGIRAYACHPLQVAEGKVIGTLSFGTRTRDKFSDEDLSLMKAVADQVAGAMIRAKAQEALRMSEERFRSLFENSTVGIYRTTPEGEIILANPALVRMLGYSSAAELSQRNLEHDGFEPSYPRSQFRQRIEQEGEIRGLESAWKTKEGSTVFVRESSKVFRGSDGKVLYYEGTVEDITERRQAEEMIRQSELQFRAVWESSIDGMRITDKEGTIVAVNDAYCQLVGATKEELEGWSFNRVYKSSEEENQAATQRYKERFIKRAIAAKMETTLELKSGGVVSVELSNAFLDSVSGQLLLLGIFRDVTERKRADEALRESEERYRTLYGSIREAVLVADTDRRIIHCNPAFTEQFGYTLEEIRGKQTRHVYDNEDEWRELGNAIRSQLGGPGFLFTAQYRKKSGEVFPGEESLHYVRDDQGNVVGFIGSIRDITERKRAEDALRENEQRLRVALTCADIAVFNQDKDLRYTWMFNPQLGFLPEEVIGRTDRELFSRADLSRVLETKQKVLESGIGVSEEVLITLNQQEISVLLSVEPLRDSSGTIVGLTGAMIDITERKLSQQRLEQERNLLRTLIEAIPDEIAVKDVERRFVLVNPACVRALRKESAGEVLGKRDEDLIVIEFAEEGKLQEEQVLSSGKPFVNIEGKTRLDPVTGEIKRSILITKMPLRDKDGTITGLVVINRDITERKRAEVEIQRSRDWLNAILDASRDGIVAEKNEMIVYANAPYAHIYGYDEPAELTGQHVSLVQSELDNTRMLQFGRRRLDGERMPEVYEFKGRKKDGRFIDLEASVSTASIAGDEHIVATVRDITERKLLQKQLIEAQKMESIGTLAGGIAHDFNNILGIIMGHASILEQMRPDPEKFLQSIQAINKATYRGANLVRQLLTFARKTDVTMQSVLINDILNELAKLLEDTLPKTIVMELNLEKKLPSILADPTQLHQVFLNLCVNARDAIMPKGGSISIASRIIRGASVLAKFDRADAMEYIVIDVADTGTGIDEATRSRIFEPFFTTKEKGKGTGLGLATVYGIVESHRGFIDVESTVGVGSTFHVYLPVEPRQVKRDELEKVAEKEIPGGTETILVVEDEETLRDLVSFVLEGKGYRVLRASDGEEGLQLFTERMQEIALVLSDLGLPKISGEDLFRRMRQLKPEAKVILATGYIEPGTKSELLKAGARELIQKPYVPAEVLKKIREALDSAV